jgi:ribonuclease HII
MPNNEHIIGIDEVGWGCVAGPIVVCAATAPPDAWPILRKKGFRDSKAIGNRLKVNHNSTRTRFSSGKCDKLVEWLESDEAKGLASWARVEIDPVTIDTIGNPLESKNKAFRTAILRLLHANKWTPDDVTIIVDGNLPIPLPDTFVQEAIPKADDVIMPVSLASVIAKSHRDRGMRLLHKQYPQFNFEKNVGYPTPEHLHAILDLGPVKGIHRMHYLKKWVTNWYIYEFSLKEKKQRKLPQWLIETGWLGDAYSR